MTTKKQFSELFSMLGLQLRATDSDEGTFLAYYEALKDVEHELLAMAAKDMGRTSEWFPKASEWRRAAHQIEQRLRAEQVQRLQHLAEPLCSSCRDTGWALDAQNKASRCLCQDQRREELLGRRPTPKLLPATPDHARVEAFMQELRSKKTK